MNRRIRGWSVAAAAVAIVACATSALGGDGTWIQGLGLGPYNWSDAINWDSGAVAGDADATATFSAPLDTNGAQIVNLDLPVTIGHITFQTPEYHKRWNISGPEALTLEVTTGTPTITGVAAYLGRGKYTISANLAGSQGLTITGNSPIEFMGSNGALTGTITVDGGMAGFPTASVPGTGRVLTGINGGIVASGPRKTDGYPLDNAFLQRLIENDNTFTVATGCSTANDIDLSSSTGANLPHATLGVLGYNADITYSGTITPSNNIYRLGGGELSDRRMYVSSKLTDDGANPRSVIIYPIYKGSVVLTNSENDYSGGTTLTNGVSVTGGNLGTGPVTLDGGTWVNPTGTNPVVVTANNGTVEVTTGSPTNPTTLNAPISGDGDLTLRVPAVGNAVVITQVNVACTYTGGTLLTNGDARAGFRIGIDNALPVTTVLTLQGNNTGSGRPTWFDLNGHSQELAGIANITRNDSAIVNGDTANDGILIVNDENDITYQAYLGATNAHPNISYGAGGATGIAEGDGDNFSLTKKGSGRLTLTQTNTYTGDTVIKGGVLSISNPYLADAADVHLTSGAMFDLNFNDIDVIDELFFDGVGQISGTWGAIDSGAEHESDLFTGTGWLSVTTSGVMPGDINGDDIVDGADYVILKQNFGTTTTATWEMGDLNGDHDVNIADLNMLVGYMGSAAGATLTPEPVTMMILAAGLPLVLKRRRSRN